MLFIIVMCILAVLFGKWIIAILNACANFINEVRK